MDMPQFLIEVPNTALCIATKWYPAVKLMPNKRQDHDVGRVNMQRSQAIRNSAMNPLMPGKSK